MLCADGGGTAAGLRGAVFAYNHDQTYVATVLVLSLAFADDPTVDAPWWPRSTSPPAARRPLPLGRNRARGLRLLGAEPGRLRPRRGADPPGGPGPVRRRAAVTGADGAPGDLLFFGTGPAGVDHVGIYVGDGLMVEPPTPGPWSGWRPPTGPAWSGATRPG